jgi:uncharacterized Fe-S center protein
MVKVYFSKNNISALADKVLPKFSGKTGIKVHFGEPGNETFLNPKTAEAIYQKAKKIEPDISLIECNVLYKGERAETKSHLKVAKDHGFDFAPIDICDTNGDWAVPVNLEYFKDVKLGKSLENYENIIVVSHFKGHGANGFGGALKNIGMGLGSRAGKMAMHKAFQLSVDDKKCIGCGICAANCPAGAIEVAGLAKINLDKCIGCAACITNCPQNAINFAWNTQSSKELQEKIVEYAFGVLKNLKPIAFFNELKNITATCDCHGAKMKKETPDIGFLASTDPVALDQASFDLVNKEVGYDLFEKLHRIDSTAQLEYAEKLGLGSRKYELIDLDHTK